MSLRFWMRFASYQTVTGFAYQNDEDFFEIYSEVILKHELNNIYSKIYCMKARFGHVTVAGTFDRLHEGHKKIIENAFKIGDKVSIGLTTDKILENKTFKEYIQPYSQRKATLKAYLNTLKNINIYQIFPLSDIYGIARFDPSLEAIVVSKETYASALKINKYRKNNGLLPLKIIKVVFVKGVDRRIIRSVRIRRGEIDRKGFSFASLFASRRLLELPTYLRESLRKPVGRVFNGKEDNLAKTAYKVKTYLVRAKPPITISVGDIVTKSLINVGFIPDIQIVDFKSKRKKLNNPVFQAFIVKKMTNKGRSLSYKTVQITRKLMTTFLQSHIKEALIIRGEEDLLVLPTVLFAPLGSVVVYGQADLGIVAVEVTEEKKKQIVDLIRKFR